MLDGPQDIPKHQALLLGVLLLGPQQWIHRRVEQVSYIDASTVRRRISIDFEVPDGSIVRDAPGPVYVPIAQLAKRTLSRFDLRDSDGCSLPMVTKEENAHISTAMLLAVARQLVGDLVDSVVEDH